MDEVLLATHDDEPLRAYVRSAKSREQLNRLLNRLLVFASSWSDEHHLASLASSLEEATASLALGEKESEREQELQLWCRLCHVLAGHSKPLILLSLFASEKTRSLLLAVTERKETGKKETSASRKEASGAVVKLCLFALRDKSCDLAVSNFVRFLFFPLRSLLRDSNASPQCVANASQIIAARCAAYSFDKSRMPDEISLFAAEGFFDDLAARLPELPSSGIAGTSGNLESEMTGVLMNAISGIMVSPAALELIDVNGVMMTKLRKRREKNKQAAAIVDSVELTTFKVYYCFFCVWVFFFFFFFF